MDGVRGVDEYDQIKLDFQRTDNNEKINNNGNKMKT